MVPRINQHLWRINYANDHTVVSVRGEQLSVEDLKTLGDKLIREGTDIFTSDLGVEYLVFDQLGAGGMSNVHLALPVKIPPEAKSLVPDKPMVVKSMKVQNDSLRDRFFRQIKINQAMNGTGIPNVIPMVDSGTDKQGNPFFVEPYVDGYDLSDPRAVKLTNDELFAILADVAITLEVGHGLVPTIIHRDIKPANILVSNGASMSSVQVKGKYPTPFVLDYGIGKEYGYSGQTQLTQSHVGMGTPQYMPPEQFNDSKNVDVTADWYALGATMYHLFTGQRPHPGKNITEIMTSDPVEPKKINARIPPEINIMIKDLMRKDPWDRGFQFDDLYDVARKLRYMADSPSSEYDFERTPTNSQLASTLDHIEAMKSADVSGNKPTMLI